MGGPPSWLHPSEPHDLRWPACEDVSMIDAAPRGPRRVGGAGPRLQDLLPRVGAGRGVRADLAAADGRDRTVRPRGPPGRAAGRHRALRLSPRGLVRRGLLPAGPVHRRGGARPRRGPRPDRGGGRGGQGARGGPVLLAHPGEQRQGPRALRQGGALHRVHPLLVSAVASPDRRSAAALTPSMNSPMPNRGFVLPGLGGLPSRLASVVWAFTGEVVLIVTMPPADAWSLCVRQPHPDAITGTGLGFGNCVQASLRVVARVAVVHANQP